MDPEIQKKKKLKKVLLIYHCPKNVTKSSIVLKTRFSIERNGYFKKMR